MENVGFNSTIPSSARLFNSFTIGVSGDGLSWNSVSNTSKDGRKLIGKTNNKWSTVPLTLRTFCHPAVELKLPTFTPVWSEMFGFDHIIYGRVICKIR